MIKLSASIINSHFTTKIINTDIDNDRFSENAKIVSIRPIFKKIKRETV